MKKCGEHEVFCCGARVRICDGEIDISTKPRIAYCPLHEALYGTKRIDEKAVVKTVQAKMKGYGFCCENRAFDDTSIVPYGASEMMKVWLKEGLIECAVVVCEGAGTVITTNPSLVQGIGARLTGIVRTSPIKPVIQHIQTNGGTVLDKNTAKIDQAEGVKMAIEKGFRKLSVSVAGFQSEVISRIRELERESGVAVVVFSVCNTCATEADVEHILDADIVCASASKIVRENVGSKALMQLGVTIPVYVLTERGKQLVLAYLSKFGDRLVVFRSSKLPYLVKGRGPTLKTSNR